MSRAGKRGRFAGTDRVVVEEYHVHPRGLRDLASYVGLFLIAVYWIRDLVRQSRKTGYDDVTIVATVLHKL